MESPHERATNIARRLLSGDLDLLEGSRMLAGLRHELNMAEDSSFLVFAAVDSDADEWPRGEARKHVSESALARADTEIQEYLDQVGPEILAACREVLEKLR